MVSYEIIRNSNPTPGVTTVPTTAEKNGDFQGLANGNGSLITIYNPSTTVLNGDGTRTPFPNNIIPPTEIDPVAANLLQYFPNSNVPGNAEGFNNFVYAPNDQVDKYYALAIRLDHQLTENNKLTGIFVRNVRHQIYPTAGLAAVASSGYSHFRNNIGGSLDWTSILSPSTVVDTRVGVMYHPFSLQDYGDHFDLSPLGFPPSLLSALPNQTFPNIQLSNYTSLGASGSQFSTTSEIDASSILSKAFGRHLLKVGFQFNNMRATLNAPESNFGNFGFIGEWTQSSAVNASGTSGWDFADLLLGYPDDGSLVWNNAYAYQRNYYAIFLQDDWRVNSRLTVNLGIRWSYESPFSERWNRQNAGFCASCTNPISPLVTGFRPLAGGLTFTNAANRLPFNSVYNDWAPRLGVAYRLTSKSVLRGGFGIVYAPTFDTGRNNGYSVDTPYVATTNNYTPANVLSNPYPSGINVPVGSSEGLSTLLGSGFTFGDPGRKIPRVEQYSFGLEYQLPSDMMMDVSYFGNRATLETSQSINALPAEYFSMGTTALNALAPNPMYGFLPSNSALAKSNLPLQNLLVPYPEFGSITESNLP
ncbi:MAG: TonB-dependent receptor domain-containing protein, partial [Bryobacteraceae bacterium]